MRETRKKELARRTVETLFRESHGAKCDIRRLARETGIAETTLRRYKRIPEIMTLGRFEAIAKAMDSTPEEVGYIVTGERNG